VVRGPPGRGARGLGLGLGCGYGVGGWGGVGGGGAGTRAAAHLPLVGGPARVSITLSQSGGRGELAAC
jgi:hypothetical protein